MNDTVLAPEGVVTAELLSGELAQWDVRREGASSTADVTSNAGPLTSGELTTGGTVELLLKNQRQLDLLLRDTTGQRSLIPKLLAIAVGGFTLYGIVATVMLNLAHRQSGYWLDHVPPTHWNSTSAANLTVAYVLGLIAANGICLPSFYFYGLLAGVRINMLGVTAHALKGMAAGALALVGILPIYVALALSVVIYASNPWLLGNCVLAALALPFVAGVWGAASLYRGFVELGNTIPHGCRDDRMCLLRRLILAWSGCYTVVTPLVVYSLWQHL